MSLVAGITKSDCIIIDLDLRLAFLGLLGLLWIRRADRLIHLEDEAAVSSVNMVCDEERTVLLVRPTITDEPSFLIYGSVKVISPTQREGVVRLVILIGLNEVILGVPGHGAVISAFSPIVELWSPEIHEKGRSLVQISNCGCVSLASDHSTIVSPVDLVRFPNNLIGMPIYARLRVRVIGWGHCSPRGDEICEKCTVLL